MNREEKLALFTAYLDGKTIQSSVKDEGKWYDCKSPYWLFDEVDYRIKPEPRKVYIWESKEHKVGGKLISHVYDEEVHTKLIDDTSYDCTVGWNINGPFELKN